MNSPRVSRIVAAALLGCQGEANASAIFNASAGVSAYEMFDVTATTIPWSGNVMRDATVPPNDSPSWPTTRVCSPANGTVSRSQPRP